MLYISPSSAATAESRVGEGREEGTEPRFLGDDLLAAQVGLADGHGRKEQRAGSEKDFRPVDLAGILLVGFFLSGRRESPGESSWWSARLRVSC